MERLSRLIPMMSFDSLLVMEDHTADHLLLSLTKILMCALCLYEDSALCRTIIDSRAASGQTQTLLLERPSGKPNAAHYSGPMIVGILCDNKDV
jgi:hypothetical protein